MRDFISFIIDWAIQFLHFVNQWPIVVKIILVLFLIIIIILLIYRPAIKYKYQAIDNLFTDTERQFYFKLVDAINGEYYVFAKVRVADVLTPNMEKQHWQGAFNKIKAKHFDYVLCDEGLNIIATIELDDESHLREDRIERDIFLNQACKTANVPLIRFYTNEDNLPGQIHRQIKRYL